MMLRNKYENAVKEFLCLTAHRGFSVFHFPLFLYEFSNIISQNIRFMPCICEFVFKNYIYDQKYGVIRELLH